MLVLMKMKQTKYLTQLKNSNKKHGKRKYKIFMFPINTENGKGRTCNSTGIPAEWLSLRKKNDAYSASYWKK